MRPEPNVHKHRHMLPKSVKIKRSLSQLGQEPRWKRAKANEDPPVSEQRDRRALGSRATGRRGAIWCICAEELGCYFPVVLQEGCWCLLRQNSGCSMPLGFPSNGKTQPQPGCYVQAPICPCPPPLPNFLASPLEERAISVISPKQECWAFISDISSLPKGGKGGANSLRLRRCPFWKYPLAPCHPQLCSQRRWETFRACLVHLPHHWVVQLRRWLWASVRSGLVAFTCGNFRAGSFTPAR